MTPIVLALIAAPSAPVYVALADRGKSSVTVVEVASARARTIAQGDLGAIFAPGSGPAPAGKKRFLIDLATDGRRLVMVVGGQGKAEVWMMRLQNGKLRPAERVPAPARVGAVAATAEGRFLVGTDEGSVAWILPYRSPRKGSAGQLPNTRGALKLTGDRSHYTMRLDQSGLGGDTSWSILHVGRLSRSTAVEEGSGEVSRVDKRFADSLYLPARREVWTFDGDPSASVFDVSRGDLRRSPKRFGLPSNYTQVVQVRPNLFLMGDTYGRVSLVRLKGREWHPVGATARLPEEIRFDVTFRVSRDALSVVAVSAATGSVWTIPILGGKSLGLPKQLVHRSGPCMTSASY